jgi:hypothetical protein
VRWIGPFLQFLDETFLEQALDGGIQCAGTEFHLAGRALDRGRERKDACVNYTILRYSEKETIVAHALMRAVFALLRTPNQAFTRV